MAPFSGISAIFHLFVIMLYEKRKVFVSLLIILGIVTILALSLPGAVRKLVGKSSNVSRVVSLFERFRSCDERIVVPGGRHIVLRLDDVQANTYIEPTVEIIMHTVNQGIPMTAGIIPLGLFDDQYIVSFLRNNRCDIEFAQHGWDHNIRIGGSVPEFGHLDEEAAYTDIVAGKAIIEALGHEEPVTFIPPGNQYSSGTAKALIRAGFDVISAEGTGKYDYDGAPIDYYTGLSVPVSSVIERCSRALDKDGLCVIMLHPQDYSVDDILIADKFAHYVDLLEQLKKLDASFVTLRDLAEASVATPPVQYSAWLDCCTDHALSLQSLEQGKDRLNVILPMWYVLDNTGRIYDEIEAPKQSVTEKAKALNIPITPSITNELEGTRVSIFLENESRQSREIEKLIQTAVSMGYQGWDLDWEGIPESDRDRFTEFVRRLAGHLHANNLTLSVTVHAQTGTQRDWEGVRGQDIAALALYADTIRVMAYDFHHSESEPGPVTPMDWLENVVKFSVKSIPSEKLVLGLPTYGYDWSNSSGAPVQYDEAVTRFVDNGAMWSRDAVSFALTGTYTEGDLTHTVWFEDGESTARKVALAREYGVYQFTFWRLGGEDPLIWRK